MGCGEPWTRPASFSMFWSKAAATSRAAKWQLRKLLKKQMRPPSVMITDKLASYGAAKRETMTGIEHRQHKGHSESTFPQSRKILAEILAGVPDDEQAKIAGGNTARVYNFDVARVTVPA